jgi:uncharacterized protein (DUF433 family)
MSRTIAKVPAYPTLMELRSAGWSVEEIATTYGVTVAAVTQAMRAGHPHGPAP